MFLFFTFRVSSINCVPEGSIPKVLLILYNSEKLKHWTSGTNSFSADLSPQEIARVKICSSGICSVCSETDKVSGLLLIPWRLKTRSDSVLQLTWSLVWLTRCSAPDVATALDMVRLMCAPDMLNFKQLHVVLASSEGWDSCHHRKFCPKGLSDTCNSWREWGNTFMCINERAHLYFSKGFQDK